MEPAKGRVQRLTEHIMAPMQGQSAGEFNWIYGHVAAGLETAEKCGVILCPDNDQAIWSKYCALPLKSKRAILAMMEELEK